MKKNILFALLSGATVAMLSGCITTSSVPEEEPVVVEEPPVSFNIYDFEGIPSQEYYVGGGFVIRYRAPSAGVLYVADDETKRLLSTISLSEGEKHEVFYDFNDEKLEENLESIGINPQKARIKVYFVPKSAL